MKMPEVPERAGPNGGEKDRKLSFRSVAPHALKIPGRVDIASWDGKRAPERRWIVDGLLPEGNVTMLAGEGGIGKSVLALQLISACALGETWVGRHARPCKTVGVFCEDDEAEIWRRLEAVARHYDASVCDLAEQVALWSRVGLDNLLMTWRDQYCQGETTGIFTQISNVARDSGAELIVLDALHDFFGGNENNRAHARQFIGELRGLAMDIHGAVLLTAHPSLTGRNTGTGEAGSTAWNAAVRQRLYLTTPKGDEDQDEAPNGIRELKSMKANYARPGDRIKLHWHEGVFVVDEPGSGMVAAIERRKIDGAFLACLDATLAQDRAVSDSRNAGNYAPRLFSGMPQADGAKTHDLAKAMERLFAAGTIRMGTCGLTSSRHPRPSIVRARPAPQDGEAPE